MEKTNPTKEPVVNSREEARHVEDGAFDMVRIERVYRYGDVLNERRAH